MPICRLIQPPRSVLDLVAVCHGGSDLTKSRDLDRAQRERRLRGSAAASDIAGNIPPRRRRFSGRVSGRTVPSVWLQHVRANRSWAAAATSVHANSR